MSLSVDDLVSSLSSSHIGQEAIDLAALQAQLAQTLFASSSSARQPQRSNTHTCNTPITRTPSASFSFSHMPGRQMTDDVIMDEDERMVEEQLLMPSSPSEPSPSTTSVFASTDPFYLAAMQQQQQQQVQQQQLQQTSFFAQSGILGQSSPFFVRQPPSSSTSQRENHHHPLSIDTSHPIFASTAY